MNSYNYDIYFLVFATVFLFLMILFFFFVFFKQYRRRQRANLIERQSLVEEFQKEVLTAQLEVKESTLNHVSQEIHDNVGQILSLVSIQINILLKRNVFDKEILLSVKDNLKRAVTDLREITKGISPNYIYEQNLEKLISEEISRVENSITSKIKFGCGSFHKQPSANAKLILFRAFQECVNNAIKHSKASIITVDLQTSEEGLTLKIEDNGVGFDKAAIQDSRKGIGLINIQNRMRMIKGNANIDTGLGLGTSITLFLPYD